MAENIISIIMLGVVTENITHSFMYGNIFTPIKNWFHGEDHTGWQYELVNCPLCLSFWVAIGVVIAHLFCPFIGYLFLILMVHGISRYIQTLLFGFNKI